MEMSNSGMIEKVEVISMSTAYNSIMAALIIKYTDARFNDDFRVMFLALDNLEALISPKADNDDAEKNLEWLEENLDSWRILNEEGQMIRYIPEQKKKIQTLLNKTYKLLLKKLDDKGLLTFKKERYNPSQAIKEYE